MPLPPLSRERRTTFAALMQLEQLDKTRFRSVSSAHEPGGHVARESGIEPRAYGGHVYAQSMLAASRTVPSGFVCHNVSGSFLQGGRADTAFEYTVSTLLDGKNFAVREVTALQEGINGVSFKCICSFKKPEERNVLDLQPPVDIKRQYATVLKGKQPLDHPAPYHSDTPWFIKAAASFNGPEFPGLESRMVKMDDYNRNRPYSERRQLHCYSIIGDLPPVKDDPNLHAAAHLYASDRNGLFILSHLLDIHPHYGFTTTLSHTVTFHADLESLSMTEPDSTPRWFTQEIWTERFHDSRGLHQTRMFNGQDRIIATSHQDGLIRLRFSNDEEYQRTNKAMSRNGRL